MNAQGRTARSNQEGRAKEGRRWVKKGRKEERKLGKEERGQKGKGALKF